MNEKQLLGQCGETIALEFLLQKGYILLEQNWISGKNEVDLIMLDKDDIVFIEVKTRSNKILVAPEVAVTREKQRAVIRVANNYVKYKKINKNARFDIVSIVIKKEEKIISHIPNAFYTLR